ncbi:hypothetical protein Esti_004263 [Eimeria stiedai]
MTESWSFAGGLQAALDMVRRAAGQPRAVAAAAADSQQGALASTCATTAAATPPNAISKAQSATAAAATAAAAAAATAVAATAAAAAATAAAATAAAAAFRSASAQTSFEKEEPPAAASVRAHRQREGGPPSSALEDQDLGCMYAEARGGGLLDSAFVAPGEEEAEESGFSQWYRYTSEALFAGAPQFDRSFFKRDEGQLKPAELLECESMLFEGDEQQQQQQQQQEEKAARLAAAAAAAAVSSAIPLEGGRAPPPLQLPIHREVYGLPLSQLRPLVRFRLAAAKDWQQLQQLHVETFPFVYNDAFYSYICSGRGFALVAFINKRDLSELQQQHQQQQHQQLQQQQQQACAPHVHSAASADASICGSESSWPHAVPGSRSWNASAAGSPERQQQQQQEGEIEELLLGVISVSQNLAYIQPEDAQAVRVWLEQKDRELNQAAFAAAAAAAGVAAGVEGGDGGQSSVPPAAAAAADEEETGRCCMHRAAEQQRLFSIPSLLAALSPADSSAAAAAAGAAAGEACCSSSINGCHEGPSQNKPLSMHALVPPALRLDPETKDLAYVLTLAIAAPFRRAGVAAELLQLAVRYLQSASNPAPTEVLYLHVAGYNAAALSFYEKHGFSNVLHLPGFYNINDNLDPPR